jgi:hypothetical protein
VLAAVISLMAAFFVGSGWYLADKIRSEALVAEPGPAMPAYDDIQFVGLSPGRAQLRAVGDQPALFKQELYGIAWQGGIGHLGASAAVSSGVVTRPLTVMSGSAPRVGQLAALERSYFLGDPEAALGIFLRDVVVPARSARCLLGISLAGAARSSSAYTGRTAPARTCCASSTSCITWGFPLSR